MKFSFTLFFIALVIHGYSQDGFSFIMHRDTLLSKTLNEKRPLYIYLPEGYEKDSMAYPVLYILDAETRCSHAVPTAQFIYSQGMMPQSIVVGIPNVARERDFLPNRTMNTTEPSGADRFLQFITDELFEYIDNQYRADSFRVLIGHSYGGLFAMHAFLSRPNAFEGYIMIDPSFWYGSEVMVKRASNFLSSCSSLPKSVYISGNEGPAWKEMSNDAMDSLFKTSAPKDLHWQSLAYANENHGSVPFKTVYDGLRFVFYDYRSNPGMLIPSRGMIVKNKPYYVTLNSTLSKLYYTVDGSQPNKKSELVRMDSNHIAMLPIDKPYHLIVSTGSPYQGKNVINGMYEYKEPLVPVRNPGKVKKGLHYKLYQGKWDKLPDFGKLIPASEGITKNFTFPDSSLKDNFGIQYEGYLYVALEGYYDIALSSDDGSRLFIDNIQILNNDGLHGSDDLLSYRLYLLPGYHSIRVDYFEKSGDEVLWLEFLRYPWTGMQPDLKIPDELLFCK